MKMKWLGLLALFGSFVLGLAQEVCPPGVLWTRKLDLEATRGEPKALKVSGRGESLYVAYSYVAYSGNFMYYLNAMNGDVLLDGVNLGYAHSCAVFELKSGVDALGQDYVILTFHYGQGSQCGYVSRFDPDFGDNGNVRWQRGAIGLAVTGSLLYQDTIYTTMVYSSGATTGYHWTEKVQIDSGNSIWERSGLADYPRVPSFNGLALNPANTTLLYCGSANFIASISAEESHGLITFDSRNGDLLERTIPESISDTIRPVPVVSSDGSFIYTIQYGFLKRYRAENLNETIQLRETDSGATPKLSSDGSIIYLVEQTAATAVSTETGVALWTVNVTIITQSNRRVILSPDESALYVPFGNQSLDPVSGVVKINTATGDIEWKFEITGSRIVGFDLNQDGSMIFALMDDGVVYALNATSLATCPPTGAPTASSAPSVFPTASPTTLAPTATPSVTPSTSRPTLGDQSGALLVLGVEPLLFVLGVLIIAF